MVVSELYQSSVAYIEKESLQHGWKASWIVWQIQRLQHNILSINQLIHLAQDTYSKEEIEVYEAQVKDITNTISELKKTYSLSEEDIQKIEAKYASVSFWN